MPPLVRESEEIKKKIKRTKKQVKELEMTKAEKFLQQNKVVLDYNLEYKVNIHESILIKVNN